MRTQTKEVLQSFKIAEDWGVNIRQEVKEMMKEVSKMDECNYKSGDEKWCAFSVSFKCENSFNITDGYGPGDEDYLHFQYLKTTKQWFDVKEHTAISIEKMMGKIRRNLQEWISIHEKYNKS